MSPALLRVRVRVRVRARRRRAAAWVVVGFGALAAAELAAAPPVLHERIAPARLRCSGGICGTIVDHADGDAAPREGHLPAAIEQDALILPAPHAAVEGAHGEPVFAPRQAAAHQQADRMTGPEPPGTRPYQAVFNPSEFPFKRTTAYDAVDDDGALRIADDRVVPLPLAGATARQAGRDAFWGSVLVDAEPGRWIPVPSVAADARVLSYAATPAAHVVFGRDSADNLYVSLNRRGRTRLRWLSDAPRAYFAGPLPPGARLDAIPAHLAPRLPPTLRREATAVLSRLGVRPDTHGSVERVLARLVSYFRAYRNGELPAESSSIYADLARAQRGSCRHRSYAFMITALAAKIPTRYVENELHVFVEVFVPSLGWRRINLGGARVDHEISGGEDKIPYQAKGGDPFPRPEHFELSSAPVPRGLGGGVAGSATVAVTRDRGAPLAPIPTRALVAEAPPHGGGGRAAGAPAVLELQTVDAEALRGETIDVAGRALDASGNGIEVPVEIFLESGGRAYRIGKLASRLPDGSFAAALAIPAALPVGDYRLIAATPGSDRFGPSSTLRSGARPKSDGR